MLLRICNKKSGVLHILMIFFFGNFENTLPGIILDVRVFQPNVIKNWSLHFEYIIQTYKIYSFRSCRALTSILL